MPWTSAWVYTNLLSVHCIQGFSEISFSLIWFGSFYHTWCEIFSFYFKLHRCFHVLSPLNLELSKWKLDPNQKVVLHERKRHTARHVASTPPAVLYHPRRGGCTPSLARGLYLVMGYPLSWPGLGVPRLGVPPIWDWDTLPWEGTHDKSLGYPPKGHGTSWSIMGYPQKGHGTSGSIMRRCGQTHLWKQYLPHPSDAGGN